LQKVAVITDSIACMTREYAERYKIGIIPINFYAEGNLYRDWVDITPSEAYELFLRDPDSFKSSAPTPDECMQAFRQASRIAESALCITVSVKLSATYNSCLDGKELLQKELPDFNIEVFDSKSATASEGMIALAAARAAEEGKELADVIDIARKVKEKVHTYLYLDTLEHVYRSGRIPKIASQIGSVLNIKPILFVNDVVRFNTVVRNRKQGLKKILQIMRDKTKGKPIRAAVMHAYAPEEAEIIKERVAAEFDCVELWVTEFSPVMGYACGTGTAGVAFYVEEEES
jgi:DegV family protein with EDD domain